MKLFTLALLALTSLSHAADISTCLDKIDANCRSVNSSIFRNLTKDVDCKIVNGGSREIDGSRYDRKVIFFDHNSIVSVETPQNNSQRDLMRSCNIARGNINGSMVDSKASAGRLYFANNKGQLFAVTRINGVSEILTINGQSFNWVTGIAIEGKDIILKDKRGNSRFYPLEEMTSRVNDPFRSRCLSNCKRR